jgi:hypothetical protein
MKIQNWFNKKSYIFVFNIQYMTLSSLFKLIKYIIMSLKYFCGDNYEFRIIYK